MNYCPSCGGNLSHTGTTDDVATKHIKYKCDRCGAGWEETITKDFAEKTLDICPIEEES